MNKEYKQKLAVLGHEYDYDYLSPTYAEEILFEAFEKVKSSSEIDFECILDVLSNVSKAWADPEYHIRKKAKELLAEVTSFSLEMIESSLGIVSGKCAPDLLCERIICELGSIDFLRNKDNRERENDDYDSIEDDDCVDKSYIKAKPKGIVLHINSGNKLYFDIIGSWVEGIITRNVNILKIDSSHNSIFSLKGEK